MSSKDTIAICKHFVVLSIHDFVFRTFPSNHDIFYTLSTFQLTSLFDPN